MKVMVRFSVLQPFISLLFSFLLLRSFKFKTRFSLQIHNELNFKCKVGNFKSTYCSKIDYLNKSAIFSKNNNGGLINLFCNEYVSRTNSFVFSFKGYLKGIQLHKRYFSFASYKMLKRNSYI